MKTALLLTAFALLFITVAWSQQTSQPASEKEKKTCTRGDLTLKVNEKVQYKANNTRCECKRTNKRGLKLLCDDISDAQLKKEAEKIKSFKEKIVELKEQRTSFKKEGAKVKAERVSKRIKKLKAKIEKMSYKQI